jgi:hypothetical protein
MSAFLDIPIYIDMKTIGHALTGKEGELKEAFILFDIDIGSYCQLLTFEAYPEHEC